MTWSLAFPNLLVGLREGLEAGLVVTILIGAVRRVDPQRSLRAVWTGVAAAGLLSLSFGAVLTFTRAEMSPRAQEVFGGVTSLIAVVLVTSMVFWMRRAARGLSGEIRSKVGTALEVGGTALVVTAFLAVAREGLEAALFIWTNAQAAGSTTSPLVGALIGLVVAFAVCAGLYRRVLKVNLGRFFTVTGAVLVVIVAGVLAYGITDLQDAGILPGLNAVAFDVSAHVPTGTWWTEIIRGVTNLNNRMSWLQVVAYVGYIAVVLPLFLRGTRVAPAPAPSTPAGPVEASPAVRRRVSRRSAVVVAAFLVPVVAAGVWIAVDHGASAPAQTANAVTVRDGSCGSDWSAPRTGTTTYAVTNASAHVVDVEVVSAGAEAVVAEIEVLGPGTTRDLPATLDAAAYHWTCIFSGAPTAESAVLTATGATPATGGGSTALDPATAAELAPVVASYRTYVTGQLAELTTQVAAVQTAVGAGDRAGAEAAWVTASSTYHRIGAAYDAFGDAGTAVDGLAAGRPGGTADAGFVGLHRIEADLWGGRPMTEVAAETTALATAVAALPAALTTSTLDPNDVTVRAHEIVEDTIRFVLTGESDYGSGAGFVTAQADLAGDRVVVDLLAPLLTARDPSIVDDIHAAMDRYSQRLTAAAATGTAVLQAPLATRQAVDAAAGDLAEVLAPVPDLLEVRAQ